MEEPPALDPGLMDGKVGVFWRLGGALIADALPLGEAESYGDCLTHPRGHYELWEAWRADAALRRRRGIPEGVLAHEYDEVPRGRVVFHVPGRRFWLYADRRLLDGGTVEAVARAFGLPAGGYDLKRDSHYI